MSKGSYVQMTEEVLKNKQVKKIERKEIHIKKLNKHWNCYFSVEEFFSLSWCAQISLRTDESPVSYS